MQILIYSKRLKAIKCFTGFSLAEMLVSFVVIGVFVAASMPLFSTKKISGTDHSVQTCIVKENAASVAINPLTGFDSTALNNSSTACKNAITSCRDNYGKACDTLFYFSKSGTVSQATASNKVLRAVCDLGGTSACDYFVARCATNTAYCDDISSYYDLHYYLSGLNLGSKTGHLKIVDIAKKHYFNGIPKIVDEVQNACGLNNGDFACNLVAQKCASLKDSSSCSTIVSACTNGKTNACKYGYNYGINKSCKQLLDVAKMTISQIYGINPDGTGGFNTYCDMVTDGGGWTLIASYVDGSFFNNCSDVGMSYGTTCSSSCAEFADTSAGGYKTCDTPEEKAIQDAEIEKLKNKYKISSAVNTIADYKTKDVVIPAYYKVIFNDTMFYNDQDEYIIYELSKYTRLNMKEFYINENTSHLDFLVPYTRSNLATSLNPCNNFDFGIMMADNDGGTVNFSTSLTKKYAYSSEAKSGPGWDSSNNGGCHFDEALGWWGNKRLGSQNNEVSTYMFWFVR